MIRRLFPNSLLLTCAIGLVATATISGRQPSQPAGTPDPLARVDGIFERWDSTRSPGCVVGVRAGETVLERAYGMADLEHDVPNATDTIIEAGSVSKQFTAMAVLLLAQDGKLSLDDPVRKYIPELPEYELPLLIRHMLSHTSGLRDWGNVAAIAGWPRTTRVYTHAHVLDIVARQRVLNFPPGTQYSYSNSGYNLAAILVSRVSGEPFADFTRRRIFEPLGMKDTSWRDDHARIVRRQAVAYQRTRDGAWRELMPFENVHGNGGLLTTVGDLLKWNENFDHGRVGGPDVVARSQRPAVLNDGVVTEYAAGLRVADWRGVPEVGHAGATAGYRAYLTRFPGRQLSIAMLCNASNADADGLAHAVAEGYLGDALKPVEKPAAVTLDQRLLEDRAGVYRSQRTGSALRLTVQDGKLRLMNGPEFVALSRNSFAVGAGGGGGGARVEFETGASGVTALRVVPSSRDEQDRFAKQRQVSPSPEALAEYAGRYRSDEAEVELLAAVDGTSLVLRRRPGSVIVLAPAWADTFTGDIGTVVFSRDTAGRVSELRVSASRVYDLRFQRVEPASAPSALDAAGRPAAPGGQK